MYQFCAPCHQKNVQAAARFTLDQVVAARHRRYVLASISGRFNNAPSSF